MNIRIILFWFLAIGIANNVIAQDEKEEKEEKEEFPEQIIKLNPLGALVETLNLSYEVKTQEQQSFNLNTLFILGYNLTNELGIDKSELGSKPSYSGFVISPEYRFYLGQSEELKGMYMSPFYSLLKYNVSNEYSSNEIAVLGHSIGVLAGYQAIVRHKLVFDFNIGLGKRMHNIDYKIGGEQRSDFIYRLGLNFGIAF